MYSQVGIAEFLSKLRDSKKSVKFMQVLDKTIFLRLKELARARGVTVQELIRVLIIPDWMRRTDQDMRGIEKRRIHKRMSAAGRSVPVPTAMRTGRTRQ